MSSTRSRPAGRIALLAATALFASVAFTSCATEAPPTEETDPNSSGDTPAAVIELYEVAKEEGAVTWWTSRDPAELAATMQKFQARFPGIEVELVRLQPQEAAEKVVTESRDDVAPTDVVAGSVTYLQPLLDRGLLQTRDDWAADFGVPEDEILLDGTLLVGSHIPVPFAYNTDLIDEADVPRTWDELVDPKFADGKLVIESRLFQFAHLAVERGQDSALELLDEVLAENPLLIKGAVPGAQALASGEATIAAGPIVSELEVLKAQGAPIDWVPQTDVMPVLVFGNAALAKAPHPNAALLLTWWLNSPEAAQSLDESGTFTQRLTGGYIPELSQEILDSGATLVYDTEDNVELIADTLTKMTAKIGG